MFYKTELIEEIIKSKAAKDMLYMLPPVYGKAYVFLWLLQAIGAQLDDMTLWSQDYKSQVTPQTATWTLSMWEKRYGISSNQSAPIEKRRQAIINKKSSRNPMNPARLEMLVNSEIDMPVKITENTAQNTFEVFCEGYLDDTLKSRVRAVINKYKPSHLIYTIKASYMAQADVINYTNVASTTFEKFNVEVI